MTCETVQLPGGATAIVCSRGRRHRACSVAGCARTATLLCDAPKGRGRTCDAAMCAGHATEVGPDLHHCPSHADAPTQEALL